MENGALGPHTLIVLWRVDTEIKQGQGRVPIRVLLMVVMHVKEIPREQPSAGNVTAVQVGVWNTWKKEVHALVLYPTMALIWYPQPRGSNDHSLTTYTM